MDVVLSDDIEADGGFIEKENIWGMQQSGDEFHFHPFAEREFANGSAEQSSDIE